MVEATRTLQENFGLSPKKAMYRESEIRRHFPEAWIEGYEGLISAMTNHPKDRHVAREGILLRLRNFRDVEVITQCEDGSSAIEKILELSPDLVFLDVQMPDMDGFEVLRALPQESLPKVVFLTAYKHHAVRAFEVNALDYLLKPVDDERFAAAIERARGSRRSPVVLKPLPEFRPRHANVAANVNLIAVADGLLDNSVRA
jgi:CheY-like chemotaxis protein